MKHLNCPSCLTDLNLKPILLEMPLDEPIPNEFLKHHHSFDGNMPEMKCIKCGWQGSILDAEKAFRIRRFIWTDEDALEIESD